MPDYHNSTFHEAGGSVHHVEERCPNGIAVAREDRVPGAGGLRMCDWCRDEWYRRRGPAGRYYNQGR